MKANSLRYKTSKVSQEKPAPERVFLWAIPIKKAEDNLTETSPRHF